jgi:hypothetical protein
MAAWRKVIWIALIALTGAAVLYFIYARKTGKPGSPSAPANHPDSTPTPTSKNGTAAPQPSSTQLPLRPGSARLLARIQAALRILEEGRENGSAELDALRAELAKARPQEAIDAILQFLATGHDAATGLPFELGEGGLLSGAPSLRTFLLDQLGQLARITGGGEAAQMSRTILEAKTSADEWALALRNLGWSEPASIPFLAAKTRELLRWEPWLEKPSRGFLEAFDVAVYTRDASFVPRLSELMGSGRAPLEQASAVALDRLAEAAPLDVMNVLNGNPALLADRPLMRADYFAKADLTQPVQRQAVETYLARRDVSLEEKAKFAASIAEPGTFVSDNLLTAPPDPAGNPRQREALIRAAQDWARRFPELRGAMEQLQSDLRGP